MQQKYKKSICSISNIRFQVLHKGKIVNCAKSNSNKNRKIKIDEANTYQSGKSSIDGFIPTHYRVNQKQFAQSLKILKKSVLPIKGLDFQHKSFPSRKIRTSQSQRIVINKKEKNFQMGEMDQPIFTNPRLSSLVKQQKKQKEVLPSYMSKSMLDLYNSQRSVTTSSKLRKSIF